MDTLTITHHSGTLRTVRISGESYSVAHLYCTCADATIALAPHKHDPEDSVSVKIHCPTHGTLNAAAIVIVEGRRANDKRVAWGIKQRRTA